MVEAESNAFGSYHDLFAPNGTESIARLIAAVRERRTRLAAEWQSLSRSRLSSRGTSSVQLFHETYVPRLREAAECLAHGDGAAFIAFAHGLGAGVADAGMPFAVLVTHVSLLKESCVNALADRAVELRDALVVLDRITSCLVGAAADGYYERLRHEPADARGSQAPSEPPGFEVFHGLVGRSAAMHHLFERIRRVAAADSAVLVVGETGTGKELVARAIHAAGVRYNGPFVALNCAALPRELIEAELFGHRRGAFSGAVGDGAGLIRAAAGGTLLLDEITEMGPELQAKLLRVLQERTVRPVGSAVEEPVDVRFVASTNRDPAIAIDSGHLRADLYYRLSVSTLVVPPLRDHPEDIPALVEHHLQMLNQRPGDGRMLTPDALAALAARPWRGNVRELFNVVEDAFTMSAGVEIGPSDLGRAGPSPAPPTHAWVPAEPATFRQHERLLLEQTLAVTGGNKLRAAQRLGISRKKLYAMIARHGLAS